MSNPKVKIRRTVYNPIEGDLRYTISRPSHMNSYGTVTQEFEVYDAIVRREEGVFVLEEIRGSGKGSYYHRFGTEFDIEDAEAKILERVRGKAQKILRSLQPKLEDLSQEGGQK